MEKPQITEGQIKSAVFDAVIEGTKTGNLQNPAFVLETLTDCAIKLLSARQEAI